MTLTQRVARKKQSGDFNMDYFTTELKAEDLPQALRDEVPIVTVLRILAYVNQRECINWELQQGYMTVEEAADRLEYIRQCLRSEYEYVVKYAV